MRILDARDTADALPWGGLAEALREMLRRRHAGGTLAPERIALDLPGGTLLVMPASDGEYASTKLASLHDDNPARGLPTLIGEVILMKADTGERLAMFDGPTTTARRTAALSALAALELTRGRGKRLLVFGCGVQARAHLDAFVELLSVREVRVHSRTRSHVTAFVRSARDRGIDCRAVEEPIDDEIATADFVVTATASTEPLFEDCARFAGFVAAVGAFRPQMCELPAALLRRAELFVDDAHGARGEAGDLLRAGIDWTRVTPLEDVVAGAAPRPRRGPVVFKSVGQALWDLAACRFAWERISGRLP